MSYIDTERELNKITDSLETELRLAGAIDAGGHSINKNAFNRIIDEKIKKCFALSAEMEESGKRFDANSANIIGARIDFLRTIKGIQSLTTHKKQEIDRETQIIEKNNRKKETNGFLDGIKKLFRKNPTLAKGHSK